MFKLNTPERTEKVLGDENKERIKKLESQNMYLIEMVTEMKNTIDMVLLAGTGHGSMVSNIKGGGDKGGAIDLEFHSPQVKRRRLDSLNSVALLKSPSPERSKPQSAKRDSHYKRVFLNVQHPHDKSRFSESHSKSNEVSENEGLEDYKSDDTGDGISKFKSAFAFEPKSYGKFN